MSFSFSNLYRNDFVRNVVTLLTWNSIAQLVTLITIPILTRLYTPEEFGAVALFIGIVNVFSVASTARYDMTVVLPKRNGQAFHLLIGSIFIALIFSIVSLLVVFIFFDKLTGMFDAEVFKKIIWLLPLCIFFVGSHQSIIYWFNRKRSFRLMGVNRLIQNSSQAGVRLGRNFFSNGNWGLVTGFIVGEILSWFTMILQLFKKEYWRLRYISFKSTSKALKEYINFPIYLMPMGVLNSISIYILVFALSIISTTATVGHYERAWRVINFPLVLISSSFGSVFYEKMTRTSNRKRLYLYSYFGNLGLAILILSPIAFWGEEIFSFVLGPDWRIAGKIARIILPLTIFNYATNCISTIFSVIKKNQLLLIWQILYLTLAVGWIYFAKSSDIYFLLNIFSIGGAILYAVLAYVGFVHIEKASFSNKIEVEY